MKFVAKTETFYGRKLVKRGETIASSEKLDLVYPALFERVQGIKAVSENKPAAGNPENKPAAGNPENKPA